METKDFVYLGLMVLTAAVFYGHGYLSARSRARKGIAAIFNDRRALTEMPPYDAEQRETLPAPTRGVRPGRVGRSSTKIRAVFGIN